ncbi:MAG: FAD/NAD(P)-binding oxidoreductase [Myxococcota bacterium]
MASSNHRILIIGGGSAGIMVAARLRRAGQTDIALIEPSDKHYYQPLWTLVGGGCAPAAETERTEASVIPRDVRWIRDGACEIDPDSRTVATRGGETIGYDFLVVAPGIQLDWDKIPGLNETLGQNGVSSNYRFDLAPKTWEFLKELRGGTAVFAMPAGPIKCAGAPQKIAYLAAHYWQQLGILKDIHVVLAMPTPAMFAVREFAEVLTGVAERYGIDVRLETEMTELDPGSKELTLVNRHGGGEERSTLSYDVLHAVPPQSAPDWIKNGPLATKEPTGYVDIDKFTMQHVRWPDVFALGDAGSSPNSKTGAAIRKQAPVVTANLLAVMDGKEPTAQYDGYASCPLTTARPRGGLRPGKMLLAEFDYSLTPKPTIPLINTIKERRDMWYLKRYGLSFLYWNMMLKGR